MNNNLEKSPFHVRLLYVTTIGLILSNVLTLALAYTMVTGVKDSIYQAGVQPLRTQARTPLQYDDSSGGSTPTGGWSCPPGANQAACTQSCSDGFNQCADSCSYAEDPFPCLSDCQALYSDCTRLCKACPR